MDKRNLLITVLILITAASLGTAIFYYNQAKNQNQSQTEPANTTQSAQNPASSENLSDTATPEQKNTPAGSGQNASSVGASSLTGSSIGGTSSNSSGETAGSQASPAQNSLQAQIEEKYTARLASVGSSYEGRLNGLVGAAFSEYQAAKKADPNADVSQIANKYYAAGQALQAECDNKIYAIIDAFESELQANSLPADAADKARATYEATKSDRAGQILSSKP